MRLLVSWLRDFVDVTASAEALAENLAFRGFEVASIESVGTGDAVIDLEITANRPDCLSVLGIAREVATLYDTPLRLPATAPLPPADASRAGELRVTIEDPLRCPRYCGALAEVRIAPSPPWMQQRLGAAGV